MNENAVLSDIVNSNYGVRLHFKSKADEEAAMRDFLDYDHEGDGIEPAEEEGGGGAGSFNPKVSDWKDQNMLKPPHVFIDKARSDLKRQFGDEYDHITAMIEELPFLGDGADKLVNLFWGKNSKVYRVFLDAIPNLPHEKFCQFIGTFFFVCRFNMAYKDLWKDADVQTEKYMHPKIYNKIWKLLDAYGKDEEYVDHFWVELENAFNAQLCTPSLCPNIKRMGLRAFNCSKLLMTTRYILHGGQ